MNKIDLALEYFKDDFNCAQSVFSAFYTDKLDKKALSLSVASAFGGGLARTGNTCGAVSGALMAIGYKFSNNKPLNDDLKEKIYNLSQKFMNSFIEQNGTLMCKELIGIDLNNPAEKEKAKEKGIFETVCPKVVASAAKILTEIFRENRI